MMLVKDNHLSFCQKCCLFVFLSDFRQRMANSALSVTCKVFFASFCLIGFAQAQEAESSGGTSAMAASNGPAWQIIPSVSSDFTYTDNVALVKNNKQSDFVTRLSPGIEIHGKGGHVKGNLKYQWQQYFYAKDSDRNGQQRALNADGQVELIDQWLYLDGRGSISQQAISAFGTQSANNDSVNVNRTETSTYQWSPYIQGRLAGFADYLLRYTGSKTKSGEGELSVGSGTTSESWSGRLSGDTGIAKLGWSFDAQQQKNSRETSRDTQSKRLTGSLEFRIKPQLRLRATVGRESDDYSATQETWRSVRGFGGDWAPTERTSVTLNKERRSFGDSYNADFTHRTALTAWKLSQSKNINTPSDQLINTALGSAFDLLNLQLTSAFPDPIERAQQANLALIRAGIPVNAQAFGTIVTSRVYLARRREASFMITGARNTVTFAYDKSDNQQIGNSGTFGDDFDLSSNIRQSGFTTSWAHKLTPDSAVTLNGRRSRNKGNTADLDTQLSSLSLLLTTRLGAKTSATVGVRRTSSDSDSPTANSYDEQAVTGSLSMTF
jgi:uncharacterized protein (PEP-CTERM system associated)